MRNLAIYVHNDKNGEVSDYIPYCLNGLKDIVTDILVVINGDVTDEGREKILSTGAKILQRENKGFDFSAWKAGIEYYGYEEIAKFDNLLITNNTFYGPIYPYKEMWDSMNERECDFWGINKHPELDNVRFMGREPILVKAHLQSYWIVFKNQILQSECFKSYWKNMPCHNDYYEMTAMGELELTAYFEDNGFKSDTYMDFQKYSELLNDNPTFLTEKQVIEDRCPIIKRKFMYYKDFDIDFCKVADGPSILMNFLKKNNLYDTNFIWQDLLAKLPMQDIIRRMGEYVVLPSSMSNGTSFENKVVVVMYIYPKELIDYCYSYLLKIPKNIDIIIVNTDIKVQEECKNKFKNIENSIEYRIQENRGRDNTALYVTCRDIFDKYDYFCFVHSKMSKYWNDMIVSTEYRDHCFRSLLYSKDYINNIVETFNNNERLGLLTGLPNLAGSAYGLLFDPWTINFDKAKKFLDENYDITVPYNKEDIICPMGGMFWGRCEAFKLFLSKEYKFEDFPKEPLEASDGLLTHILERVISILIQQNGFYVQRMCPDFYAQIYLSELYKKCKFYHLLMCNSGKTKFYNSFLEKVFSLKNRYTLDKKYKVLTLLGIKITKKIKPKARGNNE